MAKLFSSKFSKIGQIWDGLAEIAQIYKLQIFWARPKTFQIRKKFGYFESVRHRE